MSTKARWKLPLVIGLAAVLLAALFAVLGGDSASVESPPGEATAAAPSAAPPAPRPAVPPAIAAAPDNEASPLDRFLLANPPEDESTQAPPSDYPVKMEELRAKLPDNLYWEMDAPTKDPEVLQKRADAKKKWNEIFGKVQSGDATEEEIHRYYDYRRKLSEDYLAMANLMLTEFGDKLPENDKGLLDLGMRMHQDRLKEVPRQTEEALARKELQDKRREEWIRNGKKP